MNVHGIEIPGAAGKCYFSIQIAVVEIVEEVIQRQMLKFLIKAHYHIHFPGPGL